MCTTRVHATETFKSLTQCFGHALDQARRWSIAATWIVLVSLPSAVYIRAQSISFFGAFNSYSQTIVAFPQGIVADGSGNLYLSGTTNLTYIPVNASGVPQSSSEFHIDSCCGNGYGLAIDNENNLYRPDISNASAAGDTYFPGMTGTCGVAKYTYNSLNNFSKSCIGTGWVHPSSVAADSSLNVYVLEASTGTIYKLAPSGSTYIQTTLYGPDAALEKTTGMSIDSAANFYIASGPNTGTSPDAPDAENATAAIYKMTLSSGSYTRTSLGSGWTSPSATAVDFSGNIWVSDYSANQIYVLVPSGSGYTQTFYKSITELRTLVTNKTGQLYGFGVGSPDAVVWTGGAEPHNGGTSTIGTPAAPVTVTVVFDAPTDVSSYSVVTQGATGLDFTDAGGGTCSTQTYAAGSSCTVNIEFSPQTPGLVTGALVIYGPAGAVLGTDNFYAVGDAPLARFSSAVISSYVGTGNACDGTLSSCGDTGAATSATLNNPNAAVFDASGNLYIADTADYAVRKITPGGIITTIAGSGAQCGGATGSCGDGGLATSATFTSPTGVAMDAAGNLYIVDAGANRIREVAAGTGIITTLAGNGNACSSSTAACGDGGAATSATFQMEGHGGAVVDLYANLVIADYGDNRLRNINLNTGIITTVAGTGTACGTVTATCGDGGQATSAQLNGPIGVGVDILGDYFIADSNDNRIRELSALTGVLTTIAGSGAACSSSPCGDGGQATSAQLNSPMTATADPAGNIYIADLNDNTIRVVAASTRLISAVAGNYSACGTSTAACGDAGAATSANLNHPSGLALSASGNIFIAEATNRVREVNITQAAPMTFTALPSTASATQAVSITNVGNASFTFLGSPTFPTGFGSSSNTCTGSLTAASNCTLAIEITPTAAGSYGGNVVFTDNNLGVTSATQSIALNGTVGQATPTITIANLPSGAIYGGSFTPTITYSGDGTASVASNSTGICTVTGGLVHFVGVGTCSLTASATAGTNYAAITGSAQTFAVGQATPTITIASLPSSAIYGGSFTPTITYSGDGTASVVSNSTGICTVTAGLVHFVAVGTCSLTTSATAGTNYAAITGSAQTFAVGQATPAITIANLPSGAIYGGSFTPTITYSGDGTASVVSNSTSICTVTGGVVHFVAVGTCSLTTSATAGTNYAAIAGSAQTFTVGQATPTITIGNLPSSAAYGGSFTPTITYSGDGTASVVSNSTGICTVTGGVVHFVAVGTCSLTTSATAGTNYAAVTGSAQTFTVGQATPTIGIGNLPSSAAYGGSFTPSITYSGDGTASVVSNSTSICTVTGGVVHFVAIGTCSLTTSATAGTNYAAITGSAQTFTVGQATPTISIGNLPSSAAYGGSFTPSITYSGDGTASVVSNTPSICSVTGGVVHFVAVGTCSLTTSATAGTNYAAITGSAQTFTVGQATPTITFAPSVTTYAYSPSSTFSLSATSTFNLAVSFSTATPSVCTVSGSTVTIVSAGTCTIQASQAGNANYAAPPSVAVSFSITQATQTITFAPLSSPVMYGVSPIALLAAGGASGSAVTFDVVSGPGSVSGNTLTITGVGTVVVAANQAGNTNYSAAAQVTRSIVVIAANLNLNFNVTGLGFGSEPLGSTSPAQTLIITNPNGSAITITGIESTGDFSASANCPTIAPSGSCSVNVTFAPSVTGSRTGTLTVTDAQSNSPQSIQLTGTGAAPGIQVTPSLLTFGSQALATTSAGQTITILNDETANLVLSNIATTGDFATTGNCAGVPAGSNCNLTVTFTPTAIGARTGTVTLTGNVGDGNQSQLVNLSGAGAAAGAALAPSVLTFPATVVGATSFLLNITLTNTGTAPLIGIAVSIVGDYTQTNVCPATLPPGATCTISANYSPTVAGTESGSLIVTDNLGTQTVSLLGTGLAPGVSLSNAQLVFGGQLMNTSSLAQTVVFTNSGLSAVNITSIVATTNFADTTNCSGSITAGASCSVNVFFTPTTAGPLSGTLTITDTAGTQIITALGQGVRPGLTVTPSFVIFGAQLAGTTSLAQTLTATNTGTVELTLNPITVSSNFSESDQCLTTLQPGASCSISLSFSPTSTGTLSGSLVISDTSGLSSTLATVSGQGTLPGLTAAPSTLSFGSLPVGTASQAQTVTVWNTGSAPLEFGPVSATGDFAETDTCASTTVSAGSYCILNVTMTPTSIGTRTGTIQIDDNADGAYLIALSGTGQQTGVTIFPTSLAFGSLPFIPSAQASLAQGTSLDVTISNTGNLALQLGGFSTQGDFSASNSCGATVAAGSSCTVTVNFVPTALGNRTGTLTITDNAGGGTQSVSLEGDGSPAGLTLSPPVLTFGVQTVGVTSQPQSATLTNNTGQSIANLTISPSGEFNQSGNCGTTLANGASCILNITITPVTTGSITGTVAVSGTIGGDGSSLTRAESSVIPKQVTGNASNFSLGFVAVSATAIPPGIGLSVPKLSFSVTAVGTPSTGETLTLRNTGTALPLTSLTISETNVPEFPFITNCPATLGPQATCTITIHFTPTAPGLRAGTLNINAGGGISAALPESGTSIVPVYQLAFSTPPASTVALGGNAGSSITVLEKNSSGNIVESAADKITLTVTGPNGYSSIYAAEAVAGVAGFNLSSNLLTTAGPYTYVATITSDSSIKPAVATETVSQVSSSVILTGSGMESMLHNTVTFTATVNAAAGTATGTVNFLDGTTPFGSGTLSAGVAAFTTSALAAGSHTITAVYSGDTNAITATSGTLVHVVIDFALSAGIGGSGTSKTVIPGGAATYTIAIAPTAGTAFPTVAILTVTGLPSGATAALTATSWTQLTSTSWQLPANTTLADVSLTFHIPLQTAIAGEVDAPLSRLPPMFWGILLLPFAGRVRRAGKRMGGTISLLLLLATGAAAMTALNGCGSTNGFFGQPQKTYIVTVTVTTGTLSHSTNVTLTVQ